MDKQITKYGGALPIRRETIEGGVGDINSTLFNVFRGFNHRGVGSIMPDNRDNQGFVFFTRPRLNLTYDNAYAARKLRPYLTDQADSIMRAIRVYLDPVSQNGGDVNYMRGTMSKSQLAPLLNTEKLPIVDCGLVRKDSPFIHILSEACMTLEGWPDETLDFYVSEPGVMKEQRALVDTYVDNYEVGDITATFRNVRGDVITHLFRCIMEYAGRTLGGELMPWPDSMMEYETDTDIRIWRLVLDESGRRLTKIGSAVSCIPYANPIGQTMNYDRSRTYHEDTREISIPFKSVGFEVNDPILIEEFNDTVYMFNDALYQAALDPKKRDKYVPVKHRYLDYFTYELDMTIHEETHELIWWAKRDYYDEVIKEFGLDE